MKENEEKKIILPKNIQKSMMDFFLQTSIPRKVETNRLLSQKKIKDR